MFPERLRQFGEEFDRRLDYYLTPTRDVPRRLREAIRYCALSPGKRIRPYLVTRCCELVGGSGSDASPAAAAIECVHAFSLIHDDLPAMDDDDLRRGRPTCHKKFGEAIAILAGDALVVLAFELLTGEGHDRAVAGRLARELALGAGWAGMIGGQTADVAGQSDPPSAELAAYIHERKTARLFETACRLGAITGGGGPDQLAALGRYGQMLGRAFQIADDLLDLTSTAETLGKGTRKDARAGKQTFPRCMGVEHSRRAADHAASTAVASLAAFGADADDLRALASYVVDRSY